MNRELVILCEYIAECEKWILACPFEKADAMFETYGTCMANTFSRARELALEQPEHITETILGFADEGEYGEQFETSWEAWLYAARMVELEGE